MSGELAELQARQIIKKMHQLRKEVQSFDDNARLLNLLSSNIDSRDLMHEADMLLEKLLDAQKQFQHTVSGVSLSCPETTGGHPAVWWAKSGREMGQ